jgi:hypothetical protein
MAGFFDSGLADELIHYESSLPARYGIPAIGLCAYEADNFDSLTIEQIAALHGHHCVHQLDGYNTLANPRDNNHILMLYEDDSDLYNAAASYINEGLKRGQLCVYASVRNRDDRHVEKVASMIVDYDKNVAAGNLLVVDLAPVYISAVCGDLAPYKGLAGQLAELAKDRADKHTRLVADCATFMFQNKHFDECTALESWGQEKPMFGSYVCPYLRSLFEKYPFDYHKFKIMANHNLAVDSQVRIIAVYARAAKSDEAATT